MAQENLNDLPASVAIARARSGTRAPAPLGMSRTALSPLMPQAALGGMGFALVPRDPLQPQIDQGRLIPARGDWWPRLPGSHLHDASRRQLAPAPAPVIEALRWQEPADKNRPLRTSH